MFIFSILIHIRELITCTAPFEGMNPLRVIGMVAHETYRLPIPEQCPAILSQLITKCWSDDPEERPRFKEIVIILEEKLVVDDFQGMPVAKQVSERKRRKQHSSGSTKDGSSNHISNLNVSDRNLDGSGVKNNNNNNKNKNNNKKKSKKQSKREISSNNNNNNNTQKEEEEKIINSV